MSQEKTFLNSIATDKDLQKKYKREHKIRTSILKRKHRAERVNLRKRLHDEIADRETHDEITNMSIFPFVEIPDFTTKLAYRFRACDLLQELKVPNFDFLIVNFGNNRITVIFGDIKTSTDHPNRIIDDILRKKEAVEKNEAYIRKNYLNDTKLPIKFEYVVVVQAFFSNEMRNAIEQKGGKMIIWQADRHAHKIGLANPGENNPHKQTMLHDESKLNSLLNSGGGVNTSHDFFSFFPQSHAVTKIKSLIQIVEYNKIVRNKSEFTTRELDDFLYTQLSYMRDSDRIIERNKILELGIAIGFLDKRGSDVFSIKKEYASRSSQEKIIKKLYVENQIKERESKEIQENTENLQKEIMHEFQGKPRIDNYFVRSATRKDN